MDGITNIQQSDPPIIVEAEVSVGSDAMRSRFLIVNLLMRPRTTRTVRMKAQYPAGKEGEVYTKLDRLVAKCAGELPLEHTKQQSQAEEEPATLSAWDYLLSIGCGVVALVLVLMAFD